MDKRSRLDDEVGDKSTNGPDKIKEAALDKLRQMEWMRNKQDSWHLARSNSKKGEAYSKKSQNKDEESYFEGTGNQKTKKNRKPRQTEVSNTVPTGFSMAVGPSAPPPAVNAWTQKKGSALFNKQSEEVDEEDEMLKLALKESLKTAEEDKRRHLERMKMVNMDVTSTCEAMVPAIKGWDREEQGFQGKDKYSPNPPSNNTDLQFIDTDEISPPSQRRRPPFPRTRKSSNPNEKVSALNKNNVEFVQSNINKTSQQTAFNLPKENFESSHKNNRPSFNAVDESSQTALNLDKDDFQTSHENNLFNAVGETKQSLVAKTLTPITDGTDKRESSDLSLDFSSKLTFEDAQGHPESNYDNFNHVSPNLPNSFNFDMSAYEPIERTPSVPIPVPKSLTSHSQSVVSDNVDDTDLMLHSFIRHDPPSLPFTQSSAEMFTSNNSQHFLTSNSNAFGPNQHTSNGLVSDNSQPDIKNYNGQNPNSPEPNLSFPSISPHGSIGKETLTGLPDNVHQISPQSHFLFPYGMNVQNKQEASNHLQSMQLAANSNIPSPVPYSSAPPGYTLLQPSVRPVPPGLNQYGYSNTNTMMPPDLRTLFPQQYNQGVSMNTYDPYQQAHLTSSNACQKDQNSVPRQSQISPNENQATLVAAQNQLQIMHQCQLQMMSALSQYQMSLIRENPVQQPVDFPHENKQPITEQQGVQQQTVETRNELQQKYLQAMQYASYLQQQLANAAQQSQGQEHQAHPYNFPPTSLPQVIPNNMFHPGMQVMPVQQPLPASQISTTTDRMSPNTPTHFSNIHSLINSETGLNHPTSDLAVGRGRGRLQ